MQRSEEARGEDTVAEAARQRAQQQRSVSRLPRLCTIYSGQSSSDVQPAPSDEVAPARPFSCPCPRAHMAVHACTPTRPTPPPITHSNRAQSVHVEARPGVQQIF